LTCHYCRFDLDLVVVEMYVDGQDVTKFASMGKLKAGRLVRELSDACLQYWGGMGFTSEVLVSRYYRYAKGGGIHVWWWSTCTVGGYMYYW
jgi:alkylation response protein AidB-like acyl-CoA dehydrogenase